MLYVQMYANPLFALQIDMQLLEGASTNDLESSSLPEMPLSSFSAKTCWGVFNDHTQKEHQNHNLVSAEASALLDVEEVVTFPPKPSK
jgi:hypothetical protein